METDDIWSSHLLNDHEFLHGNMDVCYQFLQYGIPNFNFAWFPMDQSKGIIRTIEFNNKNKINGCCPIINCKFHTNNPEFLENHLAKKHQDKIKTLNMDLPPFWKFIKINAQDKFDSHYFDFLHIKNNSWLKINNYKCISRTKELMRCNVVRSSKEDHGHKKCCWAAGYNAVLIHTIYHDMIITKAEFAISENWKNSEDRFLDFTENDMNQLFKGLKQCLEEENDAEITNLIEGYKDSNFGVDLLKIIVAFIEELMNNYRFDKALNLIKYIESESNRNIKI
jgi:hypothetical protein